MLKETRPIPHLLRFRFLGRHAGSPDIQPSSVQMERFTSFDDFELDRVQVKAAFHAWHFVIRLTM